MFRLGTTELIIILVIVILVFGIGRVGKLGGELGKAIREFRSSVTGGDEKVSEDSSSNPSN